MYWGPGGVWVEAHNSPGVTAEALGWGFAEGAEDGLDTSGLQYDSYFLVANSSTSPLNLKATFMREDGTGLVRTFTVPGESRFTLPTAWYPELSNQRFATFLESTNGVTFVAERTMYWGDGYFGGHGATGTPFTGTVGTPGTPPGATVVSVSPSSGSVLGGTDLTITGTNFAAGATVRIGTTAATAARVLNATTIVARTPSSATAGATSVSVTSNGVTATKAGAFTYTSTPPIITSVSPTTGPTTGGTQLTINGANFVGVSVLLGGKTPTAINVQSPSRMLITTPTHTAGLVKLVITNSDGISGEKADAFTYQAATATDRILAFGDSNTEGYMTNDCVFVGVPPAAPSLACDYAYDIGYPGRLQNDLRARYPLQPSVSVTNAGFGGETTNDGKVRFPGTLASYHDLAIIMEGVNDLNACGTSCIASIVANLRTMVQTARSAGKLVMVGTVLPCVTVTYNYAGTPVDYNKCSNSDVTALNSSIRTMVQQQNTQLGNVLLADFHSSFMAYTNMQSLFSGDGLHPNETGYQRMADLVENLMVINYETIAPPVP